MTGRELLSNVVAYDSYARYWDSLGRREVWEDIVSRYFTMMHKKYKKYLKDKEFSKLFYESWEYVRDKKVLPSMRAMQFAGKPIEISPNRAYNCAYMPVDSIYAFSEAMFLLLGGTGVGYSVRKIHIGRLPSINKPTKRRRFVIGDSIEGWSDSIKMLLKGYFGLSKTIPLFDYSDIRAKGTPLKTSGGKAPGPQPLHDCLHKIESILSNKEDGSRLTSLEAHDIMCHIADAVLSGGIRRAALISLFDFEDNLMMECKSGDWWELNPHRGRANNSAALIRGVHNKEHLDYIKQRNIINGYGEPGIFWTEDEESGTNPCAEIRLKPFQFCNLTNIDSSEAKNQEELEHMAELASFVGTLQAGLTDFHYLREEWRQTTEEESLIGVGLTAIAVAKLKDLDLASAADVVRSTNRNIASMIGITSASRTTCVKPDGNTGALLGKPSGIHPEYAEYYIRRKRLVLGQPLHLFLKKTVPLLLEQSLEKPTTEVILTCPISTTISGMYSTLDKQNNIPFRDNETSVEFLNRVKQIYEEWILPGHISGPGTNNVSCTVSVRDDEWDDVFDWMWENRDSYNAISILPYDGKKYKQAPFEEITKEKYDELESYLKDINIDFREIREDVDMTELKDNLACAGAGCEV